jgi:hypothetical protein
MCNITMFFRCFWSALMEKHEFYCSVIPWNCTWYCTVQVLYFFIAQSSLEDYAKTSESLIFIRTREREREREREYAANVQCSVHFIITLFNVGNFLQCVIYQLNFNCVYVCCTNITLHSYDVIYNVQYYPQFSVTAVGLGTYYSWIRRSTCII